MRVLVVDDDELFRQLMSSVLARGQHEALLAASGPEALELARRERPDLVVSDVFMRGMDGFRLCMKWQRDSDLAKIPFVFHSSIYTSPADAAFALRLGARAFLPKPMEPAKLLAALAEAVAMEAPDGEQAQDEFSALRDYTDRVVEQLESKVDELNVTNQTLLLATEVQSALIASAPLGIALLDDSCGVRMWSPAAEQIFGFPSAEVVGRFNPLLEGEGCDGTDLCARVRSREPVHDVEVERARSDGSSFFLSLSATPLFDESGESHGILVLFSDVTQRRRSEAELDKAMRGLERAMDGSIQIITRMVEQRDPYTAGHEQRVADFAAAIGRRLGLDEDQLRHLRIAGQVHDVGKISVPAEILSKSGTLGRLAAEIIKLHPLVGAEILQAIDFGFPLGTIVAQHHERMDGSGYPEGLSGEQILLEARIIGVADVVEAMSSHRPYRPALDISEAMEEISSNRGTLYDAAVVDACIEVVASGDFQEWIQEERPLP